MFNQLTKNPMKYFNILLVLTVLLASSGIAIAQSPAALDGKTYTFVMKNGNGMEEEIIDNLTFQNGQVSSTVYSAQGFGGAAYTTNSARGTAASGMGVAFTLNKGSETCIYDGVIEGEYITGSIEVTNAAGDKTTMYFRGATTPVWEQMKRGYQNQATPAKPQQPAK